MLIWIVAYFRPQRKQKFCWFTTKTQTTLQLLIDGEGKVGHCIGMTGHLKAQKLMIKTHCLYSPISYQEGKGIVKCNPDETDSVWNWALVWNKFFEIDTALASPASCKTDLNSFSHGLFEPSWTNLISTKLNWVKITSILYQRVHFLPNARNPFWEMSFHFYTCKASFIIDSVFGWQWSLLHIPQIEALPDKDIWQTYPLAIRKVYKHYSRLHLLQMQNYWDHLTKLY